MDEIAPSYAQNPLPSRPAQNPSLQLQEPEQPEGPPVISLDNVTKRFKDIYALRNISLQIAAGEVFGLLGPNGAGKSTLLRLLLGFLHSDEGTIHIFGSSDLTRAHAGIGYLPERPRFHGNFTGREYLQLHARLAGLRTHDARLVAHRSLEAVGLASAENRNISTYSKGMRQRLGLAVAITNGDGATPRLLVLDEPASGLDPEGQLAVRDFILQCRQRGSTVLLCSHQLTEVERICSTVGILRAGKLVAQTSLQAGAVVHVTAMPTDSSIETLPRLVEYLKRLHPGVTARGGATSVEPLFVTVPTGANVPHAIEMKAAALRAIVDARWDITSVHVEQKDVESLYFQAMEPPTDASNTPAAPRVTEPLGASLEVAGEDASLEDLPTAPSTMGPPTSPLPPLQPDLLDDQNVTRQPIPVEVALTEER